METTLTVFRKSEMIANPAMQVPTSLTKQTPAPVAGLLHKVDVVTTLLTPKQSWILRLEPCAGSVVVLGYTPFGARG